MQTRMLFSKTIGSIKALSPVNGRPVLGRSWPNATAPTIRPSHSWNLPLIECIACGCPSLTTNNTAQADFIQTGIYPEELILTSRQREPMHQGGTWWPIDREELTGRILAMLASPEQYLAMESRCLESIKAFTWGNAARTLSNALAVVMRYPFVKGACHQFFSGFCTESITKTSTGARVDSSFSPS